MPIPAIGLALSRALPAASNLLSKAPGLQGISSLLGGGGGDQAQGAQQGGPGGAASSILQRLKSMIPGAGGQD
jgi:hypothetical protein